MWRRILNWYPNNKWALIIIIILLFAIFIGILKLGNIYDDMMFKLSSI